MSPPDHVVTVPNHVLPLGVQEADVLREQRAAERRVIEEANRLPVTFPRSEARETLDYVLDYGIEQYHRMFAWIALKLGDLDPEQDDLLLFDFAYDEAHREIRRALYRAEEETLAKVVRDYTTARRTLARRNPQYAVTLHEQLRRLPAAEANAS